MHSLCWMTIYTMDGYGEHTFDLLEGISFVECKPMADIDYFWDNYLWNGGDKFGKLANHS